MSLTMEKLRNTLRRKSNKLVNYEPTISYQKELVEYVYVTPRDNYFSSNLLSVEYSEEDLTSVSVDDLPTNYFLRDAEPISLKPIYPFKMITVQHNLLLCEMMIDKRKTSFSIGRSDCFEKLNILEDQYKDKTLTGRLNCIKVLQEFHTETIRHVETEMTKVQDKKNILELQKLFYDNCNENKLSVEYMVNKHKDFIEYYGYCIKSNDVVTLCDQLWVSRYILQRLGLEIFNTDVTYDRGNILIPKKPATTFYFEITAEDEKDAEKLADSYVAKLDEINFIGKYLGSNEQMNATQDLVNIVKEKELYITVKVFDNVEPYSVCNDILEVFLLVNQELLNLAKTSQEENKSQQKNQSNENEEGKSECERDKEVQS